MGSVLGRRRETACDRLWLGLILLIYVSAASATDFNGGSGILEDPYQIATVDQLLAIPEDPNAHYALIADVNLADREFESSPLGKFSGTLDGRGHRIENLTIKNRLIVVGDAMWYWYWYPDTDCGLFAGLSESAEVRNLHIVDANVVAHDNRAGLLAEWNSGHIVACSSSGSILGGDTVGGLVGSNSSLLGRISQSFSTAAVLGVNGVGGLVGGNGGIIEQCYSNGLVDGNDTVGGLVGNTSRGNVSQCYSTGAVKGHNEVGGLVGDASNGNVFQCYSTGLVQGSSYVGGLVGDGSIGSVFQCLWDVDRSGESRSYGGGTFGLTTEQMKDTRQYALCGWANDPAWVMVDKVSPPRLAWEQTPGQIIPEGAPLFAGQGTAEDPYRLDSALDIVQLGNASGYWDDYLVMTSNIDLQDHLFSSAVIDTFRGTFDGCGHHIENLEIQRGDDYLGLFALIAESARVRNLGIVDSNVAGIQNIGTLVAINRGDISYCFSSGSASGIYLVGCLAGTNMGRISQSYTHGPVSGNYYVGGLVGENYGELFQCYSTGEVDSQYGYGLAGWDDGKVFQCLWDMTSSGQTQGAGTWDWDDESQEGMMGLTTSDMFKTESYLSQGWDWIGESANGLHEIWQMPQEPNYPNLSVFAGYTPTELVGEGTFDLPFQLSTAADLATIFRYPPYGVYELSNDIDMAGITWSIPPIPLFEGHFDGQGFAIRNLTLQGRSYTGLFGQIGVDVASSQDTVVQNLVVVDANVSGYDITGVLAGKNHGQINNCHATGLVFGHYGVGGLVGWNQGEVIDSTAVVDVNASLFSDDFIGYEGDRYPATR